MIACTKGAAEAIAAKLIKNVPEIAEPMKSDLAHLMIIRGIPFEMLVNTNISELCFDQYQRGFAKALELIINGTMDIATIMKDEQNEIQA